MVCVLCGGSIEKRNVEEEVRAGTNHILVTVEAEVCLNCGERYFSEGVIDSLIDIKESAEKNVLSLKEIGKVYKAKTA